MFPEISLFQVKIPTYFLYLSILSCVLLGFVYLRAPEEKKGIALDLAVIILIFGTLGGRLFHVLFEMPEFYFRNPSMIFKFWYGGFVYYGGFILGFAAALLYMHRKKLEARWWMDFFAPVIALGYGLGRGSCLFAGCCYGKPWLHGWVTLLDGVPRHPSQVYAMAWELCLFALLLFIERKASQNETSFFKRPGSLFWFWLGFHSLGRLWQEPLRDDFRGQFIFGSSISFWLSLILIVVSIYSLRPKKRHL